MDLAYRSDFRVWLTLPRLLVDYVSLRPAGQISRMSEQ
jgi:hypothetical protein